MHHERLDQWYYVIGAYAVALVAMAALVGWTLYAMRRAEARRDAARKK